MLDNVLPIAIVGVGPRGLNVFERVCANARQLGITAGVELVVTDSNRVGTGSVRRTDPSSHLLMNTVAEQVMIFTDDTVEMAGPVERGPASTSSRTSWPRSAVSRGCPPPPSVRPCEFPPPPIPARPLRPLPALGIRTYP
ncbi:FAD/NAD(P)-binding protein [Nocardia sp. CA-145437]|uniref:FAD/NAD(P)-binding protein n=1 Tax=Nocardia sp. CA-145437 TaxID=3239980 RepID=UPI003D9738C1